MKKFFCLSCLCALSLLTGCVETAKQINAFRVSVFGKSEEDKKIEQLGQDWVFYFFSNNDIGCRNMAIFIKTFSEVRHWKVCEIVRSGTSTSGQFAWTSNDDNLFKEFDVNVFPTGFVVNRKANIAIKVIDADLYNNLENRIIYVTNQIDPNKLQNRIEQAKTEKLPIVILDGITSDAYTFINIDDPRTQRKADLEWLHSFIFRDGR